MAYVSDKELRAVLVSRRAENRGETPNELDEDQILQAISDAQAQVDLALGRRYIVPFADDDVHPAVKEITLNIAAYLALLTFRGANAVSSTDPASLRYERVRRMLNDIRDGKVDLAGLVPIQNQDDGLQSVFNAVDGDLFPLYPTFREGFIPLDKLYR